MKLQQRRLLDSNHRYSKMASLRRPQSSVFVSTLFHKVPQLEL